MMSAGDRLNAHYDFVSFWSCAQYFLLTVTVLDWLIYIHSSKQLSNVGPELTHSLSLSLSCSLTLSHLLSLSLSLSLSLTCSHSLAHSCSLTHTGRETERKRTPCKKEVSLKEARVFVHWIVLYGAFHTVCSWHFTSKCSIVCFLRARSLQGSLLRVNFPLSTQALWHWSLCLTKNTSRSPALTLY